MNNNNQKSDQKNINTQSYDSEQESFHETKSKTTINLCDFKINLSQKKGLSNDLMNKIASKTVKYIKKNEYIRVNFTGVLKFSLFLLFIEYWIYFILQMCFSQIPNITLKIQQSSIYIPIVMAILNVIFAASIILLQLKKNQTLVTILKIFEFLTFGICLSKFFFCYI